MGSVVVKYNYDAWGNCVINASTTNTELANLNPFRYRSYYYATKYGRTLEKQLIKILKHQVIKKALPTITENFLSDFTSWYAQTVIEKTIERA